MPEQRGMNERVRRLRTLSLETQPHIDLERARSETATYAKYEGALSLPELRAQVLYDYFATKTLYIGEGELIVGEKGNGPQAAPTFPELCCHTLEDMRVMNERELISFTVRAEDLAAQEKEIIPYWKDRCVREKILAAMTDEWRDCYAAGMFTEFMEQRGPGHTCGGDVYYHKGFLDLKAEAAAAREALDFLADPEAYDKAAELRGMEKACDAVMLSCQQFFIAGLLPLPLAFTLEKPAFEAVWQAKWLILYAGVMSSAVGYTLQMLGQKRVAPATASLILCLESVFAAVLGALILHETLSPREMLGCALMLAAVVICQLPAGRKKRMEEK